MLYFPLGLAIVVSLYIFRKTKMPKHQLRDRFRELPEEQADERINHFEPGGKFHHHATSAKEKTE